MTTNTKLKVFLVNTAVLVATLAGAMFIMEDADLIKWIIGSIVANGGAYTAANAVINGQKSRNYHDGMDTSKNS